MWRWNLPIFIGDFAKSIAHRWQCFSFIGSPTSSVSTLIQTALLIVQYLQRGLSLDRAFSEACREAYVHSQHSAANQKVPQSVSNSFLSCNTSLFSTRKFFFVDDKFNDLRVDHGSYYLTEIWYPGTFLKSRLNVNITFLKFSILKSKSYLVIYIFLATAHIHHVFLSPTRLRRLYWRNMFLLCEHMKPGVAPFLPWGCGQILCPQLSLLRKILTFLQYEVMDRS